MSDHDDFHLEHKDDFEQVYDLEDPRPYYQGLRPADYRMPQVAAAWLRAKGPAVARSRGRPGRLRILDFACGYGAVGAMLRHALTMRDLYRHYAGPWRRSEGRTHWDADRVAFLPAARDERGPEIGGLDVAAHALEYARHVGFIDVGFAEDISTGAPSAGLRRFLGGVDLVVECGSLGPMLTDAIENLLRATRETSRPWFLYCPRPDIDWRRLHAVWDKAGYETAVCVSEPVRYRKPLSAFEQDQMLELARGLGHRPERILDAGYLLVQMTLARPRPEPGAPNMETFRFRDDAR